MKRINIQGAVLGMFIGEPHDSVVLAGYWGTLGKLMRPWSLEADAVEWAVKR